MHSVPHHARWSLMSIKQRPPFFMRQSGCHIRSMYSPALALKVGSVVSSYKEENLMKQMIKLTSTLTIVKLGMQVYITSV